MIDFFKKRFNAIKNSSIDIKGFLLSAFIILFALEIMHLTYGLSIIKFFANTSFVVKWILSYLFILGIEAGLLVIIPKLSVVNIITSVIFYILGFSTEVLCTVTGDPLLPTDLLLIKNLGNIASFVEIPFTVSNGISLIILILSCVYFIKREKKSEKRHIKLRTRFILIAFGIIYCVSTVYLTCISRSFRHDFMNNHNIQIAAFNPKENYLANGVVLTFFPRIGDIIIEKPENYSKQIMSEIKNKYSSDDFISKPLKTQKPNVIAIQNEAWWDPSLIPNAEFSQDPLPTYRELLKKGLAGELISPVYAGGTCMPEFEFLTGFTTKFLPTSVYPYIQSITSPTPSLASAYKENGYETIAFHSYKRNFYGRNKAYPLMGFDSFISVDEMKNPELKGWYISDIAMARDIIKMYEEKKADRLFLFGVTMQNHGGYEKQRYDTYDIEVTSDKISENDLQGLKDFTQGAYDGDMMLKALIDYFENVDEPTIIVMYGDHLPLLGTEGSTYVDGGFVEKESVFQYYKHEQLYHTPYVIWANYDLGDLDLPKEISPGNLGLQVAKLSSLSTYPWYFSFLDSFYKEYPVYENIAIKNENFEKVNTVSEEHKEKAKTFEFIEYDIINGKQFSYK